MHFRHFHFMFALLIAGGFCAGCGSSETLPATSSVAGKITCQGKTLGTGTVMFFPVAGGKHAVGMIGQDGSYSLSTYKTGDGAVPGKHKVVVNVSYESQDGAAVSKDIPRVPDKYSNVETTPLIVDVSPEDNSILLELK